MKQEITVRASSWGSLFDCAYRWEAEHILGMRRPSALRTWLGTSIHHGTAVFDQARIDGTPIKPDDACGAFVDTLQHPTEEVDFKGDATINLTDAEVIGLKLITTYCSRISPQFEYKAVEMKLDPMVVDVDSNVSIRLTGTMDRARIAKAQGGVVIPDVKTGARIISNGEVQLKGKSAQLGAYQLMYENTTGEQTVGGQIIGLQTTAKAEAGVSKVFDAKRVMLGTNEEKGLIEYAAVMFTTGTFPPNPQSTLCSPKFCVRWDSCPFHE